MVRHVLAVAALFATWGFGQGQDKTFYFTHPASAAEMEATARAMTIIAELRSILPDPERQALVVHGPLDKLVTAEWLFHQLDLPAATAESKLAGEHDEVLSLFRISPSASSADLTQLITAIRLTADLQPVTSMERLNLIVARGPAADLAAAGWIVRQLSPFDGAPPTGDSPACPMEPIRAFSRGAIRIFRMKSDTTSESRLALMTAIRTITAMQMIFPFDSGKAVILRGPSDQMAMAEWLIQELDRPSEAQTAQATTMAVADGVVRIFYLAPHSPQSDLSALATQLRTGADIQRIFPYAPRSALVVRGRPDQVRTAEGLVNRFIADVR